MVAIACTCELLAQRGLALSRHFASSIWQVVTEREVQISLRTVQRMLAQDHRGTPRSPLRGDPKPWRYRSWIHSRDPHFLGKARGDPRPLPELLGGGAAGPKDQVISADEKTSIQARWRQAVLPGPGRPGRVEHDDQRRGALQYLAAWDVRRGIPRGRCERTPASPPSIAWSPRS